MQCDLRKFSVLVVVVDLHRTTPVTGSFDVAGTVGAAGCEGTRTSRFAGWG